MLPFWLLVSAMCVGDGVAIEGDFFYLYLIPAEVGKGNDIIKVQSLNERESLTKIDL
jgi:hypothetical protein